MAKIILSPKEIFEREFKVVLRGYDKDEIDEFLDEVIKDYETYATQIEMLRKENDQLREQLKNNMTDPEPVVASSETQIFTNAPLEQVGTSYTSPLDQPNDLARLSASVTNFDILKRISRLEKEVFGKQIVE